MTIDPRLAKPVKQEKPPRQFGSTLPRPSKYLQRSTKPLRRSAINPRKLGRAKLRRMEEYSKYLRSPEWQAIRQAAFKRDGGFCQCKWCIAFRKCGGDAEETRIAIWFRRGKVYGFSTHHTFYPPNIWDTRLEHVVTTIPLHHGMIEAQTGKRQAWLLKGIQ